MDLKWIAESNPSSNGNAFIESFDIKRYYELSSKYVELSKEEKSNYKGLDEFNEKNGLKTPNSKQKNYKKIFEEIEANLESESFHSLLHIDIYAEKETIMDLLASLENENYIKSIYKAKKKKVSGELKTDTANKIKDSIRQGRSLLQSAQTANMLSKPLIDFYAASAYAYASIVINSPLHKSLDTLKGSHGYTYEHADETIRFGGSTTSGTFIDLLASIYLPQVVINDEVQFKYSAVSSLEFVQTHEVKISLLALFSTVPELHDQFMLVKNAQNRIYRLSIESNIKNKKVTYVFTIGDGKSRPTKESIQNVFNEEDIEEIDGKYRVYISADKIDKIMPTIYQDIKGNLWYIDPLIEGLYLPEICLHFLIISALCNIMRYSPHEWNNILTNKISSEFSLLVSKYLHLFELKYPMLLIQQLTNYMPIINP